VKAIAAIFCGLLLIVSQLFSVAATASAVGHPAKQCCACGGQMACCSEQSAPAPQPTANSVRVGSENQLLSPVPVVVVGVLATTGTPTISPTVSLAPHTGVAPLFARHCSRLI